MDVRDGRGRTPLHGAAFRRQHEAMRALVAAGADSNIADRAGVTPLAQARGRGYSGMVKVLEARKAR